MAEVEPTMGRPYCKKQQESEQADERWPYEMTAHNFSLRACNRCYARYNELLSQGFLAAMPPRVTCTPANVQADAGQSERRLINASSDRR